MFHSIRWRLVASYVLLALLTVSVVGLLSVEIVRRYSRQQETAALRANAEAIAEQALPLILAGAPDQELQQLAQAASFLGESRVRILDNQGQAIADSGVPGAAEELILVLPGARRNSQGEGWLSFHVWTSQGNLTYPFDGLPLAERLSGDTLLQRLRRYSGPWGGRLAFSGTYHSSEAIPSGAEPIQTPQPRSTNLVRQPVGDSGDPVGYVEVSAGRAFGTAALTAARRAFLLGGTVATVLAVLFGLVMSQRLTSPLRQLGEAARRMGAGDLSVRATDPGKDEIGLLARQFNQMAGRLQASFSALQAERDALRRFVADASHELRTPITALKNFLTLLQGPAAQDQAAQLEFLAESQAQVDRLEWITRNLLDLTRLDAGLIELESVDHDLGELIAAAVSPFRALFDEKGIQLQVSKPAEPVVLRCDQLRLEMALANLLDNALKFTPQGGSVIIGAGHAEKTTRIWVADNGPGIDPQDLPHIFERFYRGRGQTGDGSGLGLAIVKSLVEAQGGRVAVESEWGRGTKLILEWDK